jgi:hypothetical protein
MCWTNENFINMHKMKLKYILHKVNFFLSNTVITQTPLIYVITLAWFILVILGYSLLSYSKLSIIELLEDVQKEI